MSDCEREVSEMLEQERKERVIDILFAAVFGASFLAVMLLWWQP